MSELGPCGQSSQWVSVFVVVVNALQALGIAFIAARAARKNREDKNGHSRVGDEL